jgi:hypothetical protein
MNINMYATAIEHEVYYAKFHRFGKGNVTLPCTRNFDARGESGCGGTGESGSVI